MSKKDLKNYLNELSKSQLQEQIIDLYDRFKPVKTFYNFVFEPKEQILLNDAKTKISKEYFPLNGRKPKARRSVAQKIIKHYLQLGVDPNIIADIMLFNIELAQQYNLEKKVKQDVFYKSLLNSFKESVEFITKQGLANDFLIRLQNIEQETKTQNWINAEGFESILI